MEFLSGIRVDIRRCAACSELRTVRVSVHCGVHATVRNVLKHVQVVREDVRSLP